LCPDSEFGVRSTPERLCNLSLVKGFSRALGWAGRAARWG
jgi:hypothetical protein